MTPKSVIRKKWSRKCGPISCKFQLMVLIYAVHRADTDAACLLDGHPVRAGADAPYHVGAFALHIGRLLLASSPVCVMVGILISSLGTGERVAGHALLFRDSFRIRLLADLINTCIRNDGQSICARIPCCALVCRPFHISACDRQRMDCRAGLYRL